MKHCRTKRLCSAFVAIVMIFAALSSLSAFALAEPTKTASYTGTATVEDVDGDFTDYGISVNVVMNGDVIESVTASYDEATYDEDNDPYWNYAVNGRTRGGVFYPSPLAQIVDKQSTNGIDAVSGATCTSVAMVAAVRDALSNVQSDEVNGSYVLMNIPYADFYGAVNAANFDVDAVSSATNKVGNTNKAGGSYHSAATAAYDENGEIIAVGAQNGAHLEGTVWPVRVENEQTLAAFETLGGIHVTDDREVTVATMGHGSTTSTVLTGKDSLMEAPSYSYYVLDEQPAFYMNATLNGGVPSFSSVQGEAETLGSLDVDVSYNTNWGDIQFDIVNAAEVNGKQVNAMVITADDGTTAGMIHLYNIWSYNSIAWNAANTQGLDGKTITSIRYYCNDKQGNYFVYDYSADIALAEVYEGSVTAEFDGALAIDIEGLPEDAHNVTAVVYYSVGRQKTYLTETTVDDTGKVNPVYVPVENGRIALVTALDEEKTVTVAFKCDNYVIHNTTATYVPPMLGDVDGNGSVEAIDAMLVARYALELIEFSDAQLAAADVTGNGEVTITDAILILRYAMGYIDAFAA